MRMEIDRDEFETVTWDPDRRILELEWADASARLTDQQFMDALSRFAGHAEEHHAPNVIIDVTRFLASPGPEVAPWRDENVIPVYNRAGVRKFAFLVPPGSAGAVEGGGHPSPEPPGAFPTGYFGTRERILA